MGDDVMSDSPSNLQPRPASHWRNCLLFWGSLMLAVIAVALAYRICAPPAALCFGKLIDAQTSTAVALPLSVRPARDTGAILVLEHQFRIEPGNSRRPSIYLGQTTPFYAIQVNARDLTPGIDLRRRDHTETGPHLYVLPDDALHAGQNLLILRIPVSATLGAARVSTLCIGDERDLQPAYRVNWWRQVGAPSLYVALFLVLALIAVALNRLNRGAPVWFWYSSCLLMMAFRTACQVVGYMPGGFNAWGVASDLGTLFLVNAAYRLMTLFWGIAPNRWALAWVIVACMLRLSAMESNWYLDDPILKLLFWLSVGVVTTCFLFEAGLRVRHAPTIERHSMQWVILFSIACGVIEIIPLRIDADAPPSGIFVTASAAVALVFGFLLIRRSLLGTKLLAHATRRLGHELDRALLPPPEHSAAVWGKLSSGIANDERQQMLHDINAGFGSRMLAVLEQIRSEHPHSRLNVDIQRALLDLRLMIDAMDDTSQSIRSALATLQQRMQGPLAAAGIHGTWDTVNVSDLQVDNRRKLMELFRCLEELLSNAMQHAHATHVLVRGRSDDLRLVLQVEDNGCGFPQSQANGRGLRNVQARVLALQGTVAFNSGEQGRGTKVELSVPRI
jgi:signal transduction histidine kinase